MEQIGTGVPLKSLKIEQIDLILNHTILIGSVINS